MTLDMAAMEDLRARIEKITRRHDAIPEGGMVVLQKYGENGLRAVILGPEKHGKTVQVRSVTASKLAGSVCDQANGLAGGLLAAEVEA